MSEAVRHLAKNRRTRPRPGVRPHTHDGTDTLSRRYPGGCRADRPAACRELAPALPGTYADAYLDGDVLGERTALWAERFGDADDGHYTIVAERGGEVVGFAHTCLDSDPEWGARLDNLHVRYELKQQGVGSALMAETALVLARRRPGSGLYLWALKTTRPPRLSTPPEAGS